MAAAALLALSFVFYGYWDWRFVPLLAGSILVNWPSRAFSAASACVPDPGRDRRQPRGPRRVQIRGLLRRPSPTPWPASPARPRFALPLGISFFTFHHVMYLTDLGAGLAPLYGLTRYGLYIAFFPQVLSGPLVRWTEVMHQFEARAFGAGWQERFARGLMLLIFGLAKKVFLGDGLASYANPVFTLAAPASAAHGVQAWQASSPSPSRSISTSPATPTWRSASR